MNELTGMQGHFAKVAGVYREMPGIIKLFRQLLNWVFRLLGWPAMGGAEFLHARHISSGRPWSRWPAKRIDRRKR